MRVYVARGTHSTHRTAPPRFMTHSGQERAEYYTPNPCPHTIATTLQDIACSFPDIDKINAAETVTIKKKHTDMPARKLFTGLRFNIRSRDKLQPYPQITTFFKKKMMLLFVEIFSSFDRKLAQHHVAKVYINCPMQSHFNN